MKIIGRKLVTSKHFSPQGKVFDMSQTSSPVFRCTATGDSMITRRLPAEGEYDGFAAVRDFIRRGDFRFGNLETTVHNFEAPGAARSGGSWLCSPPGVLDDLRRFGMNILSGANNHALDYSYEGLERTLHYLEAADFPFCGIGRNLADAARPVYLDTVGGRYALIGCTMTFNPEGMAGTQTAGLPGRTGVNGIRVGKKYHLPPEELVHLKRIAGALKINVRDDILRSEGYVAPLKAGEQPFGELMFEAADRAEIVSSVHPGDMKRVADAIAEARFMADYVVVAMHNHEIAGTSKESVDPVSVEFAHGCIDAGADAVIGTGPHLLRPLEIYKGKPVFYCLGDFIIQLETVQRAPDGMFTKQKLDGNDRLDVLFNNRSNGGKRGLCYDPIMYKSVIPYWEADADGLTKLVLLPIEEQFHLPRSRAGWPRPEFGMKILEHLAEMSAPYGVKIAVGTDGVGTVELG